MHHHNFHAFVAKDNAELGYLMGCAFRKQAKNALAMKRAAGSWSLLKRQANEYLQVTKRHFPRYIEEMRCYAKGAGLSFDDLWALSLENDIAFITPIPKCTTIVTNRGNSFLHIEDWAKGMDDSICVVMKTIGHLSILELFYYNTLGGNSVSVNSNGFACSVNSLIHADKRIGVPGNVLARYASETSNPDKTLRRIKDLPRGLGYNFNILRRDGRLWNAESTSTGMVKTTPDMPFVHTNHFLTRLKASEAVPDEWASFERYARAKDLVRGRMSQSDLKRIANDRKGWPDRSIFNERTIAKTVVDKKNLTVSVWLSRERTKGWVSYGTWF